MKERIAIYGAYGHTGKFLIAQLFKKGFEPILIGRDPMKLVKLQQTYPHLQTKVADIDHASSLDEAFADAAVIVNCAGPFLDTAEPVIASALRLGKHYIDISAEQKSVQDVFARFEEHASDAGITIIPGAAFYGGLADLLSTMLIQGLKTVDEISIYVGLDSWHPTKGTRLTGERNHYERLIVADHKLQPLQERKTKTWTFAAPISSQEVITMPMSEIITISRHIDAAIVNTYLSTNSLTDIRNAETPEPVPADHMNRSSQLFCMQVIATSGELKRTISAEGRDIYAVTAPIVAEAVSRIVTGQIKKSGVTTLGEGFDAVDFLKALDADDVRISPVSEQS